MNEETELSLSPTLSTNQGVDSKKQAKKSKKEKEPPWFKKYIEVIIGGAISAFLIGGVVWVISHFATKIDNIEKTIAAHHGPQWAEISKVIAVGNLRAEFIKAKQEYERKLGELATELKLKDQEIKIQQEKNRKLISALTAWTEKGDQLVLSSFGKKYDAIAHLSNLAPKTENVALLNVAHASGTRFKVGDKVEVINTGSGRAETTTLLITSAYTDLDHTDVLLQLGQQSANVLGLSQKLGKIKIAVKKHTLPKDDPNRWKTISELISEERP